MAWRLRCWNGVGAGFVENVQAAVHNNYWRTPNWLEALIETRPTFYGGSLNKSEFRDIETRLQNTLLEKKPEYEKFNTRITPGDPRWYLHPVDSFIKRQLFHIRKGCTEETAFAKVEDELLEAAATQDLEIELAKQQAEDFGIPDRTDEKFKQRLISYKQAAIRFREDERRVRREKLEQLVMFKKETGDKTFITSIILEEDGILPIDIIEYLKLYPEDTELFHHQVLSSALEQQEDDPIRVDESTLFQNQSEDELLFVESLEEENINEEIKVDTNPNYSEEAQAFDDGLNPILEKELHLYLQQYQVAGYLKDHVKPLKKSRDN